MTSQLKLRNPADRPVFFKVKTTAPRFYCVRPNSGVVKPGDTANIAVMLQPVDQAATLESERTRHKFMIQTAFAPNEDTPVDTFWKTADLSQVRIGTMESTTTVERSAADMEPPERACMHAALQKAQRKSIR